MKFSELKKTYNRLLKSHHHYSEMMKDRFQEIDYCIKSFQIEESAQKGEKNSQKPKEKKRRANSEGSIAGGLDQVWSMASQSSGISNNPQKHDQHKPGDDSLSSCKGISNSYPLPTQPHHSTTSTHHQNRTSCTASHSTHNRKLRLQTPV